MKQRQKEAQHQLLWVSVLSSLPSSAGVYWFLGKNGEVLYVGKAKDLKRRVSSYAQYEKLTGKTLALVTEAVELKYCALESELEALLVEAELIHAHQPRYNILLKDDKSPLYIVITKEEFPRVLTMRKQFLIYTNNQALGTSFGPFPSAHKVRQVLHLIRPIFQWCNEKKKTGKPCFYHNLGLCSGACAHTISAQEYQKTIRHLKEFLRGKTHELLSELKIEMQTASVQKNYEKAAQERNKISMIQEITTAKHVFGPELHLPQLLGEERKEMIVQLRRTLSQYISLPKQYEFHRIEGYDVSNTQGTKPTVSMVVFTDAQADKRAYRSFNIRLGETPNDYGMLREALVRRQRHPEWGIPDLVMVDGGKGQLRAALSVWKWSTPVVALAKEPDRLIIYQQQDQDFIIYPLEDRDLAAILLRRVRDEAHRFAKRHHIQQRTKSVIK